MPLGRIDFATAPNFEPVPPGSYEGVTDTWEAKPTQKGDSTNIEGKFRFDFTDDNGNAQSRSIVARWNLKKEALWRLRTDLINMGVDPSEFTESADLDAMLNQVFGAIPTPVTLVIGFGKPFTPDGATEPQVRNEIKSVKLRS